MEDSSRRGVVWNDSVFGPPIPSWSFEPSIQAIERVCRQKLGICPEFNCTVTFHASGGFNKTYLVHIPYHPVHPKLLMRVTLPVDPWHKTRGEVATLRWVRQCTDIPLPNVICWDATNQNDIGSEWMLMELMPGKPASNLWRRLSMEQKAALVERVAVFEAQLLNASSSAALRGIGTLMDDDQNGESSSEAASTRMQPGRIIERHFFSGDHVHYDVPRGPFMSSHDWLATELDITIRHHTACLDNPDKNDWDIRWTKTFLRVARKLLDLLPKIFPSIQHPAERTYLRHDDLSLRHILIDDEGNITAILDWEFLSCLPLWVSTQMPEFLRNFTREEKPLRQEYATYDGFQPNDTGLSDEENDTFRTHLEEWESTQLRKVYNGRMEQLRPGWEQERLDGALKVGFLTAATLVARGAFLTPWVERWVDDVGRGQVSDLMGVLYTGKTPAKLDIEL